MKNLPKIATFLRLKALNNISFQEIWENTLWRRTSGFSEGFLEFVSDKEHWKTIKPPLIWTCLWVCYVYKTWIQWRWTAGGVSWFSLSKLMDRVRCGSRRVSRKGRISSNLFCMSTKLPLLPPAFCFLHTDSLPLTRRCLKSYLIYLTVIFVLLLFFLSSSSRFPPLPGLSAMTGSWLSASRLSSSGTPTSPL